jgi:RNA binding exosome subunit
MTSGRFENFIGAQISTIVHATEEKDKLVERVKTTLGLPDTDFAVSRTEGHWGNEIFLLAASIGKDEANSLYLRIKSSMNDSFHGQVLDFDEWRDEKGNLFIRLDKQKLCQGMISVSEADPVRIRFKPELLHISRKLFLDGRGMIGLKSNRSLHQQF